MKQEYIICAAIHFQDEIEHVHQPVNIKSGFVICGLRHHNCYTTYGLFSKKLFQNVQGFLTSNDRFVSRIEAARIAFEARQVSELKPALMSEDLY